MNITSKKHKLATKLNSNSDDSSELAHPCEYLEPVYGTAVDERREHAQAVSERVANWTHCQHDVQILLHSINEVVVHRKWSRIHFLTLINNSENMDYKNI